MNRFKDIRQDYILKLGSDYNSFISNLKSSGRYTVKIIRLLNRCRTFEEFIINAFLWSTTKEGDQYWRRISKR